MEKTWPLAKGVATSEHKDRANLDGARRSYLSKSIYVDHVLRWSRFFSDGQMLVLTSEDFLGRAADTLKRVLCFLDLPEWEPEAWEIHDKGREGQGGAATKRWLEEYFEPHNRRPYEYLGAYFWVVALNADFQAIEQRNTQDARPAKWGSFLMGRIKSD